MNFGSNFDANEFTQLNISFDFNRLTKGCLKSKTNTTKITCVRFLVQINYQYSVIITRPMSLPFRSTAFTSRRRRSSSLWFRSSSRLSGLGFGLRLWRRLFFASLWRSFFCKLISIFSIHSSVVASGILPFGLSAAGSFGASTAGGDDSELLDDGELGLGALGAFGAFAAPPPPLLGFLPPCLPFLGEPPDFGFGFFGDSASVASVSSVDSVLSALSRAWISRLAAPPAPVKPAMILAKSGAPPDDAPPAPLRPPKMLAKSGFAPELPTPAVQRHWNGF
jgi:hypothetical protein